MQRIGERIKKKREFRNLHLNELAEKVGISPSALSQIEKAKSFPSVVTLKSIAENLHTTVGELIGENESLANNPVVYRQDIKYIDQTSSGTKIYLLSHHDMNKQMDTYLLRFAKNSNISEYFANSKGQVFCYILSGQIRFVLDDKSFDLNIGDSMYFNAKSDYRVDNISELDADVLWVQSPAQF
jgi:transcriptional regulator with XRE-family HTH domain